MRLLRRTPAITPREAAARLSRGELQLIDVREREEVAAVGVAGAVNLPLGSLAGSFERIDRGRPVAFLCRSGARSGRAARAALAAGFDAVNVAGGIQAWTNQGLPVVSSPRPRLSP
jgi:rhodanese-related sulfurtransferase